MGTVPVKVDLALCLPRESSTVAVTRHVAVCALREIGVSSSAVEAVELAITEACSNVVRHSDAGDEYEVQLTLEDDLCQIRVIDTGHGFDFASLASDEADPSDEQGRGIALMHALMDSVRFESRPEEGTVVHLVKSLTLDPDSPIARAARRDRNRPGG